jgi:hypothetical protein
MPALSALSPAQRRDLPITGTLGRVSFGGTASLLRADSTGFAIHVHGHKWIYNVSIDLKFESEGDKVRCTVDLPASYSIMGASDERKVVRPMLEVQKVDLNQSRFGTPSFYDPNKKKTVPAQVVNLALDPATQVLTVQYDNMTLSIPLSADHFVPKQKHGPSQHSEPVAVK